MKKGDWLILGQSTLGSRNDELWRNIDGADISNRAQGEAWIRKHGTKGDVYMIATCRAKVRCTKRPVDKFETVCEEVE
jgi:hypothetical protein